uniref:Protein phosphatase n=1 Tax=Solanum lycopersicum TaxID=4081 RepID=A0A3Q7JUI4_SOLLC
MVVGYLYLPKDNPNKPLGEDAHFMHELYQTIGVAGWALKGINVGIYTRELMRNSFIATYDEAMKGHVSPKRVLEEAYKNTNSKGQSTICIITLNSVKSTMVTANVGDSGLLLIRKGKIIYKWPIQQRGFGCSYQLGNCNANNPSVAQEMELNVEKDVILMVGTDVMLDNIFESEIEKIVRRAINEKLKAEGWLVKLGTLLCIIHLIDLQIHHMLEHLREDIKEEKLMILLLLLLIHNNKIIKIKSSNKKIECFCFVAYEVQNAICKLYYIMQMLYYILFREFNILYNPNIQINLCTSDQFN